MPLIHESHDSLPYIDPDLPPQTRTQISALLAAELPPEHTTTPHPLLPTLPIPKFSPFITAELDRVASKKPLTAIDTTRYEALSPPSQPTDSTSDETSPQLLSAWQEVLQKAYTSSTHLNTRLSNLALLEQFGKNAWLVGNSQLEEILRGVEKELVETRGRVEDVNKERKGMQEGVKGEMEGLDEAWRRGVGRVLEVEVAAEVIRREVLLRRRAGAQ
ncbi:hypothetical protein MMC24_001916 [Lignoscripta atroalba]|nr:hypothetical protein [Lignoscripta atroalba]